jgi:hypothetical protein
MCLLAPKLTVKVSVAYAVVGIDHLSMLTFIASRGAAAVAKLWLGCYAQYEGTTMASRSPGSFSPFPSFFPPQHGKKGLTRIPNGSGAGCSGR